MQHSSGLSSDWQANAITQDAEPRWQEVCLLALRWMAVLVAFYLYVFLRVAPHLFYHQNPALFFLTREFLDSFLERPGGIVAYLSALLSVAMVANWLGTAVLTLLMLLIVLATHQLLSSIADTGMWWLPLLPMCFILMLLDQYVHVVELCVGTVVTLWLARVYFLLGNRRMVVRLVVFAGLSAAEYYLASGMYLVFACLCGVYEIGVKRQSLLGLMCVSCAVMVPLAGAQWFDLSFADACGGLMLVPKHWLGVPTHLALSYGIRISFALFFPVSLGILAWRHQVPSQAADRTDAEDTQTVPDNAGSEREWERFRWALPLVAFAVFLIAIDTMLFDLSTKCLLHMVCCAEDRRWEEVLAWSERVPRSDPVLNDIRLKFQVNRALYHMGQLPDRMFAYPQLVNSPTLALVNENVTAMARATPRQCSEILFDLGRINEAEHMASEALEIYGDWPGILKRLIRINVLKARPAAAKRFLTVMEYSLLYGDWARQVARQLDEDATLSSDPAVASRRALMVQRDSVGIATNLEDMLLDLLEANPRNQMAFEYLMAHYLLTRQIDKVVANLHRLEEFHYEGIPRHYEEALVLKMDRDEGEGRKVELGEWQVRPETQYRFRAFTESLRPFPPRQAEKAYRTLHADFGDSYYFFFVFGANHRPSE